MGMTHLTASDTGAAHKLYARSRMGVLFMLWAMAMRCFSGRS